MKPMSRDSRNAAQQLAQYPVKHLLVDLDGTLLGNHGIPLSYDFIRRAFKELREYGNIRKIGTTLLAIQREFKKPSASSPMTTASWSYFQNR